MDSLFQTQKTKQPIWNELSGFYKKCIRVWHILRKPSKDEVLMVAKVSAIGILIVGLIGFLISIALKLTILK
ncbi:MAG: protein translocase SEC61 complex subunit gamma [Candidatus Pacearchaeota archaeon]